MPEATPNYLYTLPDGTIYANFPGGVEVQEGDSGATLGQLAKGNAVTWRRGGATGAVVAQVSARSADGGGLIGSESTMQSRSPAGNTGAGFNARAFNTGLALVQAFIDDPITGTRRVVVDDQGTSDFVQVMGNAGQRWRADMAFGFMQSTGAILNHIGNPIASSLRVSAGVYNVTVTRPGAFGFVIGMCTPFDLHTFTRVQAFSATGVQFVFLNSAAVPVDTGFQYMILNA